MAKEPRPTLLSVTDVIGTTLIDHGSTVAVQLESPRATRSPSCCRRPSHQRLSTNLREHSAQRRTQPQLWFRVSRPFAGCSCPATGAPTHYTRRAPGRKRGGLFRTRAAASAWDSSGAVLWGAPQAEDSALRAAGGPAGARPQQAHAGPIAGNIGRNDAGERQLLYRG